MMLQMKEKAAKQNKIMKHLIGEVALQVKYYVKLNFTEYKA